MYTQIIVKVCIQGLFDPDLFTLRVGLNPSKIERKGSIPASSLSFEPLKYDSWTFELVNNRFIDSCDTESYIEQACTLLESKKESLTDVLNQIETKNARIDVIVYHNHSNFQIQLEPALLQRIVALGFIINCDIYNLPDDDYSQETEELFV